LQGGVVRLGAALQCGAALCGAGQGSAGRCSAYCTAAHCCAALLTWGEALAAQAAPQKDEEAVRQAQGAVPLQRLLMTALLLLLLLALLALLLLLWAALRWCWQVWTDRGGSPLGLGGGRDEQQRCGREPVVHSAREYVDQSTAGGGTE
jgi:hypothetical protein